MDDKRRVPLPALALVLAVGIAILAAQGAFAPISLGELAPADVATVFLALIFAALVIERAVEVFVGNLYDGEESRLTYDQRLTKARYDRIREAIDSESRRARGTTSDEKRELDTTTVLNNLRAEANAARGQLDLDRASAADDLLVLKTRKAAAAGFAATMLGALIAAVGLRVLGGLAPTEQLGQLGDLQRTTFDTVDIVVTALLLAGGADGIHNLLGDFLKRRRDLGDPVA